MRFCACVAVAAVVALAPGGAAAAPEVKRRGVQVEGLFGVSACMPGAMACKSGGDAVRPSFGAGVMVGYRPLRALLVGAAYDFGLFDPDFPNPGDAGFPEDYRTAYQNSLFAVVRGILPIWRMDLGLEVAPGWSRQTFVLGEYTGLVENGNYERPTRESSQGFALKLAPVIDFYVSRRVFVGVKVDFIVNFHRVSCSYAPFSGRYCSRPGNYSGAPVHQVIAGFHVGATF
jgi:hypothetical protein